MTDHDLLQAAATAVGHHFDPTRKSEHGLFVVRPGAQYQEDQILWNPLEHPDQAMELAAQYCLTLEIGRTGGRAAGHGASLLVRGENNLASTCRAIVLLVVKIGKKP